MVRSLFQLILRSILLSAMLLAGSSLFGNIPAITPPDGQETTTTEDATHEAGVEADAETPVVIPFSLDTELILVDCWIGERGPYRFMLDSGLGAPFLLDDDLAAELALVEQGTARIFDSDGGKLDQPAIVELDGLRVGEFAFESMKGLVYDLEQISLYAPIHGIIGVHAFRKYLLTIDYPERELRCVPLKPEAPDWPANETLPYRLMHGALVVYLRHDQNQIPMVLDTGSNSLVLPALLEDKLVFTTEVIEMTQSITATGVSPVRGGRLAGTLKLATLEIQFPIVDLSGNVGLLGYPVLRHLELTFDQFRQKVRVQGTDQVQQAGIVMGSYYSPGFGCRREADGFRVVYVKSGGAAEEAGLRLGDLVVEVNGAPAASIPIADWLEQKRKAGTLKMVVERRGEAADQTEDDEEGELLRLVFEVEVERLIE